MNRIQLLDSKTINKIAAGEVVESPKSVVKELVENSIDAGSSAITIEIKDGGISYLRVTDNGCGIPKEQVTTAFLRHATNKIEAIEDLESVYTLGFRGEALASIAGVAQVELTTKAQNEDIGTHIEIHGGTVLSIKDVAATNGTTIVVRNLFFNVPARKKFLKRPATESGYISDIVNKFALGHPEISFQYINNNTTILHTSGNNDKKAAAFYVYGKDVAKKMLLCNYENNDYILEGLIGKPELCRANRSYENLFINGRFIKNSLVSSAIEDAYKTRLPIGKFPVYILNFSIPPSKVDVNVHPAKLEVRFENEDEIYDFFYHSILERLQDEVLIPKAEWKEKSEETSQETSKQVFNHSKTPIQQADLFSQRKQEIEEDFQINKKKSVDDLLNRNQQSKKTSEVHEEQTAFHVVSEPVEEIEIEQEMFLEEQNSSKEVIEEKESRKEPFFHDYKVVGQVFHTYWIIEQKSSLYMIDQHAAHERVLYEKLMDGFKKERVASQRLLEPVVLKLSEMEQEIVDKNRGILSDFGFELEIFGDTVYALKSVPFIFKGPVTPNYFLDIIDSLQEGHIQNLYDAKLMTVATMACKAAVKANDKLDIQEAVSLIEQLLKLENPFTCPHGRPTIIEMTKYELEKRFNRIQT